MKQKYTRRPWKINNRLNLLETEYKFQLERLNVTLRTYQKTVQQCSTMFKMFFIVVIVVFCVCLPL